MGTQSIRRFSGKPKIWSKTAISIFLVARRFVPYHACNVKRSKIWWVWPGIEPGTSRKRAYGWTLSDWTDVRRCLEVVVNWFILTNHTSRPPDLVFDDILARNYVHIEIDKLTERRANCGLHDDRIFSCGPWLSNGVREQNTLEGSNSHLKWYHLFLRVLSKIVTISDLYQCWCHRGTTETENWGVVRASYIRLIIRVNWWQVAPFDAHASQRVKWQSDLPRSARFIVPKDYVRI